MLQTTTWAPAIASCFSSSRNETERVEPVGCWQLDVPSPDQDQVESVRAARPVPEVVVDEFEDSFDGSSRPW